MEQVVEALSYKPEGEYSIPDEIVTFIPKLNPSGLSIASTQPVAEISKSKVIPLQAWCSPEGG